jgi:hypothetical protein
LLRTELLAAAAAAEAEHLALLLAAGAEGMTRDTLGISAAAVGAVTIITGAALAEL